MTEEKLISSIKNMVDAYLHNSYKKYLKDHETEMIGGKSKKILPLLSKEESLSKFGYKLSKSVSARKRALKRAIKERGTLPVLRRVNLIGNYSKSVPKNYEKLRDDVEYLKNQYANEKLKKTKILQRQLKKTSKKTSKKISKKISKKTSKKGSRKTSKKTLKNQFRNKLLNF